MIEPWSWFKSTEAFVVRADSNVLFKNNLDSDAGTNWCEVLLWWSKRFYRSLQREYILVSCSSYIIYVDHICRFQAHLHDWCDIITPSQNKCRWFSTVLNQWHPFWDRGSTSKLWIGLFPSLHKAQLMDRTGISGERSPQDAAFANVRLAVENLGGVFAKLPWHLFNLA